jgi:hypothetical protein
MTGVFGLMAVGLGLTGAQTQADTEAPRGERVVLTLKGRGVQVYACKVTEGVAAWVFQAPEAQLLDDAGAEVGDHGAGPTWRMHDGSSVVGEVVAKAPGARPEDVPWLLLRVKSHAGGAGALAQVEYVRRSETAGGVAPGMGCDAGHVGTMARVPYTATYTFSAKAAAR